MVEGTGEGGLNLCTMYAVKEIIRFTMFDVRCVKDNLGYIMSGQVKLVYFL